MHPEITCEKLEYVYVGAEFNRKNFKIRWYHDSLICGRSGWKSLFIFCSMWYRKIDTYEAVAKIFGADQAIIINDDKPVLRRLEDGWYAYGTPFSGKTDENVNKKVKLQGNLYA